MGIAFYAQDCNKKLSIRFIFHFKDRKSKAFCNHFIFLITYLII